MNKWKKTETFVFEEMPKASLKIGLLLGILGVLLGGLIIGPLTHKPNSYEIKFSDEDRAQFKADEIRRDEHWRAYYLKEIDEKGEEFACTDNYSRDWIYRIKSYNRLGHEEYYRSLNREIEERNCIPSYFGYKEDFRDCTHFEKSNKGEREGKISSNYHEKAFDNAVNRTIDEYSHRDFSGGHIMKNSALDSIGADYWHASSDGYSIVTGFWEKFHYCLRLATSLCILGLVCPTLAVLCIGITTRVIIILWVWIQKYLFRYLKWTFSEFIRPKKEEI